jgi:multimeric flavodoxin WrbA
MESTTNALNVLVLNASLKHATGKDVSNTEEVCGLVLKEMEALGQASITSEIIRLADKNIPVGLGFNEGPGDEWPAIVEKIRHADIVIFATPIWWGGRSSLMQRVIERLDAFDEEVIAGGRAELLNKVAGVVITGSEDGAQATLAGIMEVLTFMNFTLPPQCCTYWVGEVGMPPSTDRERRLKNEATPHMAKTMAKNLVYYANLLKKYPLQA